MFIGIWNWFYFSFEELRTFQVQLPTPVPIAPIAPISQIAISQSMSITFKSVNLEIGILDNCLKYLSMFDIALFLCTFTDFQEISLNKMMIEKGRQLLLIIKFVFVTWEVLGHIANLF